MATADIAFAIVRIVGNALGGETALDATEAAKRELFQIAGQPQCVQEASFPVAAVDESVDVGRISAQVRMFALESSQRQSETIAGIDRHLSSRCYLVQR